MCSAVQPASPRTDCCWISLLHTSVRLKAISSVPCVCLYSFTSVIHCSFRLRHFLKKKSAKTSVGFVISARLSVCLSVRPHVSTRLTTDGDSVNFMSVRFATIRRQIQVLFQSDKQIRYCTWRHTYIYGVISAGSAFCDQNAAWSHMDAICVACNCAKNTSGLIFSMHSFVDQLCDATCRWDLLCDVIAQWRSRNDTP